MNRKRLRGLLGLLRDIGEDLVRSEVFEGSARGFPCPDVCQQIQHRGDLLPETAFVLSMTLTDTCRKENTNARYTLTWDTNLQTSSHGRDMGPSTTPGSRKKTCTYHGWLTAPSIILSDHSDHAKDIVSAYWSKQPKDAALGSIRKRKSEPAEPPRRRRPSKAASRAESVEHEAFADTHVDAIDKYADVADWDDLVKTVDTIERTGEDRLIVYLTM